MLGRYLIAFIIGFVMSFSVSGRAEETVLTLASSTTPSAESAHTPPAVASTQSSSSPSGQSSALIRSSESLVRGKTSGADLSMSFSASVREVEDKDRESSMDFEAIAWAALGRRFRADAYVGLSRDTNGYQEARLEDARLGLMLNPLQFSGGFSYRPKLTLFLPVNVDRREIDSFRTGFSLTNRVSFQRGAIFAFYQLGLNKNFYAYETTGLGASNPSHSISHAVSLYRFFGRFYLGLSPSLSTRWTYGGRPSTAFRLTEELGIGMDAWTFAFGHTNGDSLYRANGVNSNFTFFSPHTSKYYMMANYSF